MSHRIHLTAAARRALYATALVAAVAGPALTSSAYAFNLGDADEGVIQRSAQSARYANPAETPLAVATAQAHGAQVASSSRLAPQPVDLVGQHGEQDRINQQIYAPGTPPASGG